MVKNRSRGGLIASVPAARLVTAAIATLMVAACASPGTVSSPSSAATTTPASARIPTPMPLLLRRVRYQLLPIATLVLSVAFAGWLWQRRGGSVTIRPGSWRFWA